MAKAYIMALVKFTDKDNFLQNYASKVADVFAKYDGHFLVRNPEASHKEGRPFDIHVIAEFPSLEKANEALEGPEYLEIKKIINQQIPNTKPKIIFKEKSIPTYVATPLPPLNFNHIGNT